MSQDDDKPPRPKKGAPLSPMVAFVHAYVARKETMDWIQRRVASKVDTQLVEQLSQDACLECIESAASLESEEAAPRWVMTITDRVVADHHTKRAGRKPHEGRMPRQVLARDEAGIPIKPDSAQADPNAPDGDTRLGADDPERETPRREGFLMQRFLREAVKGNARDEETLAWMEEWAEGDKSYDQIAREHDVSANAVHKRVQAFKEEYFPKYRRWRNGMILFLILAGAIVYVIFRALGHAAEPVPAPIHADPSPAPPASATAGDAGLPTLAPPPDDGIFRPSLPTGPKAP
jgi:DNA-directed RNA polymerase specialized sigma24 family protein